MLFHQLLVIAVVEDFVSQDPYVAGGLVTSHRIRPWRIESCVLDFFKGDLAQTVKGEPESEVDVTALYSRISSMSGFSKVDGMHKHRTWSWEVRMARRDTSSKFFKEFSQLLVVLAP